MKKLLKVLLRVVFVAIALCIFAFVAFLIGLTIYSGKWSSSCKQYGYERMDYISSGSKTGVKILAGAQLEFPNESHSFSIRNDLLPPDRAPYGNEELVDIRDFTSLVQCDDLKNAERIRLVRFKVKEPRIFTDTRVEHHNEMVISGGVMPWNIYQALGYRGTWLTKPKPNHIEPPSRKEKIDTFKIDWLKDEPLGEAEFVGLWRGGWLFRSKNPDQYVWID